MVVPGGVAVPYERGTPVTLPVVAVAVAVVGREYQGHLRGQGCEAPKLNSLNPRKYMHSGLVD